MTIKYANYLTSVASNILYYPVLAVLPIGIIGNVFAFYIYTRPNLNKKTNTGFLYAWLCAINLFFVLYFALVYQSTVLFKYTITLYCGLQDYLICIIFCLVPWMQVIISFDRFIAVVYPHKKHSITKKWILCLIMLGSLLLIGIASIPYMITYQQKLFFLIFCNISNDVEVVANVIAILFQAYIPFSIMLVFDIIVFKRVRRSRRLVGMIQVSRQSRSSQISSREYNFIISTLFIDLSFALFYTPIAAYISITVADVYLNWDYLTNRAINIFLNCALFTAYLYSVVLILIFFVLNRYFRSEVFIVLRLNKVFPHLSKTRSINNMNQTGN